MEELIPQIISEQIATVRKETGIIVEYGRAEREVCILTAKTYVKQCQQADVPSSNWMERWPLHWEMFYCFIGGIVIGVLAAHYW